MYHFDTSNVEDMYMMFSHCSKITSLDVSNFNTKKVTDMANMFEEISKIKNLNLKILIQRKSLICIICFITHIYWNL